MSSSTIRTRHASAAAIVALAVSALAACGDNDASNNDSSTTTTTTTTVADPATEIPDTPVGVQLRWALDHLASDAQPLTVDEVNQHVSAEFLRDVLPADTVVALFDQTIAERGGIQFERFAFDPRPESAVALVRSGTGELAALYLDVEAQPPHRIETIALDEAPAEPLATSGPHTGLFEVDGRQLFLSCVGDGEPTVVLVGGLTSDWTDVQRPVSDTTRVCSYDKPNVLGSRSEHAPPPATPPAWPTNSQRCSTPPPSRDPTWWSATPTGAWSPSCSPPPTPTRSLASSSSTARRKTKTGAPPNSSAASCPPRRPRR